MTVSRRPLTDGLIEAVLLRRAAGPSGADLLPAVVGAALTTPQRRGWRPLAVRWTRIAALAAAAVALVAALLAVGAGMQRTSRPTVDPRLSLDARLLAPSPAPVADGCLLDGAVTVGSAMRRTYTAPRSLPAGVLDGSVYLTSIGMIGTNMIGDVWVIRSGEAVRIANIDAPLISAISLSDLSPSGGAALLRIETIRDVTNPVECDALVVVATDGTQTRRLPVPDPPVAWRSVAFSPDGRFVAAGQGAWSAGDIDLYDLEGDATPRRFACSGPLPMIGLRWAPERDVVASVCGSTLLIVDVSTGAAVRVDTPIQTRPLERVIGATWADDSTILVDTQSASEGRLRRTLAVPDGPLSAPLALSDPTPVAATDPDGARSPDGHFVLSWIDDGTAHSDGYVVDLATGHRIRFAVGIEELAGEVRWSSDSSSLAYGLPGGAIDARGHVIVIDAASGAETVYDLPSSVEDGIWRLP